MDQWDQEEFKNDLRIQERIRLLRQNEQVLSRYPNAPGANYDKSIEQERATASREITRLRIELSDLVEEVRVQRRAKEPPKSTFTWAHAWWAVGVLGPALFGAWFWIQTNRPKLYVEPRDCDSSPFCLTLKNVGSNAAVNAKMKYWILGACEETKVFEFAKDTASFDYEFVKDIVHQPGFGAAVDSSKAKCLAGVRGLTLAFRYEDQFLKEAMGRLWQIGAFLGTFEQEVRFAMKATKYVEGGQNVYIRSVLARPLDWRDTEMFESSEYRDYFQKNSQWKNDWAAH